VILFSSGLPVRVRKHYNDWKYWKLKPVLLLLPFLLFDAASLVVFVSVGNPVFFKFLSTCFFLFLLSYLPLPSIGCCVFQNIKQHT